MTQRYTKAAAFHEAGHAVARIQAGRAATATEIYPDGTGFSFGAPRTVPASQYAVWDELQIILAGPIAEARISRRSLSEILHSTAVADRIKADQYVQWLIDRRYSVDPYSAWDRAERGARAVVQRTWPEVQAVAAALLVKGRLSSAETELIVYSMTPQRDWPRR